MKLSFDKLTSDLVKNLEKSDQFMQMKKVLIVIKNDSYLSEILENYIIMQNNFENNPMTPEEFKYSLDKLETMYNKVASHKELQCFFKHMERFNCLVYDIMNHVSLRCDNDLWS